MNAFENYLSRNAFQPRIHSQPSDNTGIIIVIPCFNEPCLIKTLNSIWICERPSCKTEIIVVINHTENASEDIVLQNETTFIETSHWINEHSDTGIQFHIIYIKDMPAKHAGVGLARKTGMDEAAYRFHSISKHDGIIVGFDADSCCDTNYLKEIEHHFKKYKKTPGASLYFEHPLDDLRKELNEGIALYELHLRYLNQAIRFSGHPHAFHTVGSSFAVKADAYIKQGGMNKRQAGEDFYFIQKIISLGNYSEINTTRVIPSSRESDRVPFGTGAAIRKWITSGNSEFKTYHPDAFKALNAYFALINEFFNSDSSVYSEIIKDLHPSIIQFLNDIRFIEEIAQIKTNTSSLQAFTNRFYNWFNIFKIIKFLNTSHQCFFENCDVLTATKEFLKIRNIKYSDYYNSKDILLLYRKLDLGMQN